MEREVVRRPYRFLGNSEGICRRLEKKYGLVFTRSKRSIYTVLATNTEINYLNLKNGAPISVVESISYLQNGVAAEYSKTYFRADRCTFEVVITR